MKKTQSEIETVLMDDMRKFADQISRLGKELAGITAMLEKNRDVLKNHSPSAGLHREGSAGRTFPLPPAERPVFYAAPGVSASQNTEKILPKIIPFPVNSAAAARGSGPASHNSLFFDSRRAQSPVHAGPGRLLPGDIPDFRPLLQRDGLILLAWDKRLTEMGGRFTAYWVTSAGTPRFYASRPLPEEDFFLARPHHKSYAAEDGIEFYGQEAPVYIVHVAPELMMSNPPHKELRKNHIEILKREGSEVDFDYKYLLSAERRRGIPFNKPEDLNDERARA